MKETSFVDQPLDWNNPAEQKFRKDFIEKPHLTTEDIGNLAESLKNELIAKISEASSPEEQKTFLVNFFSLDKVFLDREMLETAGYRISYDYGNRMCIRRVDENGEETIVSMGDLADFIRQIKKAVVDRLPSRLADQAVTYLDKQINKRVATTLGDNKIVKQGIARESQDHEANLAGLRLLASLPPNPHVANSVLEVDPRNLQQTQRRLELTTVQKLLIEKAPFNKVIRYFTENLKGAEFLVDNGLRLTDLALVNLGVDVTNDKGLLFDFDTLYRVNDNASYATHDRYFPPEVISRYANGETHIPVTEANMVFEFGKSLSLIFDQYKFKELKGVEDLRGLSKRMTADDPESRPTIKECIAELESGSAV